MRRPIFTSNNLPKIVSIVLLIGLIGGLGYVYTNQDSGSVAGDRAVNKTTTSGAANGSSTDTPASGQHLNKLTPPPAPAAAPQTTTWPDAPAAPGVAVNGLAVVASSASPLVGDNLTVTVYENSGPTEVNSVQTKLTYDAARLEYAGVVASADFGLEAATSTGTPGVIQVARASQGGAVSGTRAVVTIHFKVKAAGSTALTPDLATSFVVRASDAGNILQSVVPAQLTIQAR